MAPKLTAVQYLVCQSPVPLHQRLIVLRLEFDTQNLSRLIFLVYFTSELNGRCLIIVPTVEQADGMSCRERYDITIQRYPDVLPASLVVIE